MTNAIEQAKREMYAQLKRAWEFISPHSTGGARLDRFEEQLEAYLELLHQDHEALHETARARFEAARKLEAENQYLTSALGVANGNTTRCAGISLDAINDIENRLAKMTEERDAIQLRLHAVDHAYKEQQSKGATMHQDSGDRASCAAPDAKTITILGAFVDIQRIVTNWAMKDVRAKAAMREIARVANGSVEVSTAMTEFEKDRCMHSFFAIGDDQMKCTFCGVEK